MSKFTDEGARSRCTIPHLYNQAMWTSIASWRSMPIHFSRTIFFFASQSVMILSSAKDPQPVSSTACMLDRQLSGRMNSPEIFNKSQLQRPWMLMTCTTILNLRWWKKNLSSLLRSVIGQGYLKQKGKTESGALSQPFLNKAPYNSTQTKQQNNCSESKRSHKRDNYGKVKEGMNSSTHTSDSQRTSSSKSGLKLILITAPSPSRAQISFMSIILSILSNQQVPDKAGWVVGEAHEGHVYPYWK